MDAGLQADTLLQSMISSELSDDDSSRRAYKTQAWRAVRPVITAFMEKDKSLDLEREERDRARQASNGSDESGTAAGQ